ncbi:MAG: hypothetical protein UR69_C0004G0070 [Candidatus Moranbacteria bacterium GW2011_GWE2_35_2-]|nr:MAG: hypothetical protein UR69_C0004G0070 [Candidatus Moranbacteria bacterium GW2011_GWE2_35_2-]KKQ22244.1 MAG: hypothetical protein US37_C0003G0070 [Candidatus Moranbacteria bacterium GW2011_GWF2_37_11]KKQ28599.1 MAG: hypothetical protein US44_C0009G0026 [Candidatus Moranbacteria bacterium GW2011_GWD1_37_17]KKQ30264.1 MAG: hypothetical protein US47_C0003G0059 [Candidatus Moranbacteria bacterium GW2011_GWE1_37_24]KKQ47496.1 MAG: hypothetical protein US66_C0011G0012 [Candidatus Moranbacteria 
MILTTHALAGAAIGKNFDNPWLIILLSLAFHYIMDSFRHGEYLDRKSFFKNTWWKVVLDLFIGLTIIGVAIFSKNFNLRETSIILLGSFFSMLPDLLTVFYWKLNFKILEKIFNFHAWVHKHPPFSPERAWTFRNSLNDIIFSLVAIFLLFT